MRKSKGTRIAITILKENKLVRISLSDDKIYYMTPLTSEYDIGGGIDTRQRKLVENPETANRNT
jgi:hypothetical protein